MQDLRIVRRGVKLDTLIAHPGDDARQLIFHGIPHVGRGYKGSNSHDQNQKNNCHQKGSAYTIQYLGLGCFTSCGRRTSCRPGPARRINPETQIPGQVIATPLWDKARKIRKSSVNENRAPPSRKTPRHPEIAHRHSWPILRRLRSNKMKANTGSKVCGISL